MNTILINRQENDLMGNKHKLLIAAIILATISANAYAQEVHLNLQKPKASPASIEININRNKTSEDLIKLITLDGISSTESISDITLNKNSFGKYFISGDDKFAQANITAAYSDYTKAVMASNDNDFQSLLAAYKLANIGFFTLSQHAINQINDIALYSEQTKSLKEIFFPAIALTYDEEIILAELYADIYYNNLSREAVKELNKNSNLLKKSDYANYVLAQAYFESGEYNKAINAINKALSIKKNSPFYLQYKAKILCSTQDYNDALKILNKISASGFVIERFLKGIDTQKEFTLANSFKDQAKSKYHLARYFLEIGEYNRALKEVNSSISAKKRNYEAYALMGKIQYLIGEYEKAKDAFNKALSFNKKYAPALQGLGDIEKYTGTYEATLSYYTQAQKYDKGNLSLALSIAQILNLSGDTDKAKEICAALAIKYPNSSELYYKMAEIYPEKQLEYLRKSLSLNAFNSNAWVDLAEINILQNNIDTAEKYLLAVRISDEKDYKYYYVEGLLNKHNSNYSAATTSFKKALKLNPNYTPAEKELNTLNL